MDRDFKGVFIPAEIWLNDELSAIEKIIFTEIDSLDGENHCYASNEYLSDFCRVSIPTVTRAISHLKLLGYIEEVSNNGRTRVLKSNLRLINLMSHPNQIDEADSSICENLHYIENKKENNIEKAPAEPVLSPTKNRRRDLISRSTTTLVDDLESGKDIDKQEKAKKKSPKEKLIDSGLELIAQTDYDEQTKALLVEYFNWAIEGTDVRRIRNISLWKSKLEALAQIVNRTKVNPYDVVKQSLDNHYYMFVELSSNKQSNVSSNPETSFAKYNEMSEEEERAWEELKKDPSMHF